MDQALGRVGRYGDDRCVRVIDSALGDEFINKNGRAELLAKMALSVRAKQTGNSQNLIDMFAKAAKPV